MKQKTITVLIYRVVALALAGLVLSVGSNVFYNLRLKHAAATMREVSLAASRTLYQVSGLLREQGALVNSAPGISEIASIKKDQESFAKLSADLDKALLSLNGVSADPELAKAIVNLKSESAAHRSAAEKVFTLALGFQQAEASDALQKVFAPADTKVNQTAKQATTRALDLVDQKPTEILELVSSSNFAIYLTSGITLIAVIGFSFWTVQRGIVRPLRVSTAALGESSEKNVLTAGHISDSSHQLADGANQQAASIQQASASLEEMSSMTQSNAENARRATDLAKQARSAADAGVADVEAMNSAMAAIQSSSNEIAKIIKTIDEIAFQTNILALNAAVEAARAGEAGMGFAVVAEEVRNLAQRSAQAARETSSRIEDSIGKTTQGVQLTGKVAGALNNIAGKVREVDQLVAEVASASVEQTQGINQINDAITSIDKITQSNAGSAQESASAAKELNVQAVAMRQAVEHLTSLVGLTGTVNNTSTRDSNPTAVVEDISPGPSADIFAGISSEPITRSKKIRARNPVKEIEA